MCVELCFHHTYGVMAYAGTTLSVLKYYDCIFLKKLNFFVTNDFKKCGKVNYIYRHIHGRRPLCSPSVCPCMRVFVTFQIWKRSVSFHETW